MQDKGFLVADTNLQCGMKQNDEHWIIGIFKTKDEKDKPEVEFTSGANQGSIFFWEGHRMFFSLREGKPLTVGWEHTITVPKTIVISTLGGGNSQKIKDFIDSCVVHNQAKEDGLLKIYEQHPWGWF